MKIIYCKFCYSLENQIHTPDKRTDTPYRPLTEYVRYVILKTNRNYLVKYKKKKEICNEKTNYFMDFKKYAGHIG